jgi:hypothetical protein
MIFHGYLRFRLYSGIEIMGSIRAPENRNTRGMKQKQGAAKRGGIRIFKIKYTKYID